jgi:glycosyltransferase involved in cell wall biosynthesis
MKRISFIIPTRNEEKYIEGCLKSIKGQIKKNYEIIVVDTLSEDNTIKIAKRYGAKIIIEPRKGVAIARNKGARYAKGDILVFADADVRFEKDFTKKIEEKFRNNIAGGIFNLTFFDGSRFDKLAFKFWNFVIKNLIRTGFVTTNGSCFVYEKKIFKEVKGFDEKLFTNEDNDLARKVAKLKRFCFFDDIIVYTSVRRVKKKGYLRYLIIHIKSTLLYFISKRSLQEYWNY